MTTTSAVQHKPGRNIQHVLNGWRIGWCFVVADSPISKSAARAANKAVGMGFMSEYAGRRAWPYLVDGVQCHVMTDHAVSMEAAAEKGRKMANALRGYGITSRVYVMTDNQYGMGHREGDCDLRARQGRSLRGLSFSTVETVGPSTTWVLTEKQSVPVYQTSL